MFGDWELSLAAYNSGEWRVARILAEKGTPDFWSMRNGGYLPSETSEYVPRFLAAVRIAKDPQEYGFEAPARSATPFHFETVNVDRQLSLHTAAELCGVAKSDLEELNPALRRGITPSGYALRVPAGAAEPLRTALATYVETVHSARRIARADAPVGHRTAVAHADRGRQIVARGTAPGRNTRTGVVSRQRPTATRQAQAKQPARLERNARDDRSHQRGTPAVRVAREVSPFKPTKTARPKRRG